ncbi:hypothetical protein PGT21_022193 [Puccinia graminis f. sp. tritici]|uniref:Sld7 C-terminal domain-containing protein n=2 Tax=Puccinia graminis f. sp. tritici TaxID=56615 RepID=H6QQA8_PUCGT|nr:uncharacterized protein PGTG_21068 [Puccinia graminis f. sp. tritici CRL 75-36-700-3]EHS64810.1 hypothetical protein PGTG_21068 [Puccinia graminis f. sp. tritici CRL 75-36-700-3]KAA1119327.1 hypothetical protein PGT21_022193 [Puccinia graminis f. sp. tritici]
MATSSQSYAYTENSSNPSHPTPNNRLLWRGSIINQTGARLHGLAIVANAINPKELSKIRDDPFSAESGSHTLSDTCLELEMLRGRDLQIDKICQLTLESKPRDDYALQGIQTGSRKSRVASLLKGKDPETSDANRVIPFSEIECDPEVRLYVDPRCSQTHTWIISQLGKRELTPGGFTSNALIVTLDHTVDDRLPQQLVIFGRRAEEATVQPSSSNASVPLQLVIGQRKPLLSQRIPRPDDPMPRAIPGTLFADTTKSRNKKSVGTTILSKSKGQARLPADQATSSSFLVEPSSIKAPETYPSRPNSFISALRASQKQNVKVVKKPANTPGRRAKQDLSASEHESDNQNSREGTESVSSRRAGKRKSGNTSRHSVKKMKTTAKTLQYGDQFPDLRASLEEDEYNDGEEDVNTGNSFEVHRSPSPSPASFRRKTISHIPTPETLNSPSEIMNHPDRPSYTLMDSTNQRTTSHSKAKGPKDHSKSRNVASPRDLPNPEQQASKAKSDSSSHLAQNKLLIRKLTSESLNNRGLHKQHPKFKDLYGAVCRGVQFAMREALEKQAIDKNLTKTFVESHLAMYMILNSENS